MVRGKIYSVGIYLRLSVDSHGRKNESIETQEKIAKAYLERQDDLVLYGCYSDLGKTGMNFAREGFARLMADVRRGLVDCVIVKDFSRFGRDYIETGNYIQKIFPFLGVRFISVADQFDSLTCGSDEIGVCLKNLANEMYARDIAVRVKSAKQADREAGSYVGGLPPYGYRAVREAGRRILVPEEETAEVVKNIFRLFADGKKTGEIVVWLYRQEIHRPMEYRRYGHARRRAGEELFQWGNGSVRAVLKNPVYLGCLPQKPGGKCVLRAPEDLASAKGQIRRGTHEALVGEELFFRAAGRSAAQSPAAGERNAWEPDPFAGILFCGICKKRLGRTASAGQKRRYSYFCRNAGRMDEKGCGNDTVDLERLTALFRAAFVREAALNGILPEQLAQKSAESAKRRLAALERECAAVRRKLSQAAYEKSRAYARYRAGEWDAGKYREWLCKKEEECGRLGAALAAAEERAAAGAAEAGQREAAVRLLPEAGTARGADGELIRALVARAELYPGRRMKIAFRYCGPGILRFGEEEGMDAGTGEEA